MRRLFLLVASVILVDTMFYSAITPLLPRVRRRSRAVEDRRRGPQRRPTPPGPCSRRCPSGFLAARIGFRSTMLAGLALLGVS